MTSQFSRISVFIASFNRLYPSTNLNVFFVASILLYLLYAMSKFHYRPPPPLPPATKRNFRLTIKKNKKNRNNSSLQIAPNFTVLEWKCNESNVAEEYCWTITQAAGRSCCGRSDSRVLELGFTLDSLTNSHLMTMSILSSDVQVVSAQNVTSACFS